MAGAKDFGKAIMAAGQKLPTAGGAMRRVIEVAVDGVAGLPGARAAAASALGKYEGDRDKAVDALITQHVALAGAQGFATNIGGLITLAVTAPANLVGAAVIQCRLVAAIAHLRGYDLNSNQVRSAILMCLLGEVSAKTLIESGDLPSSPMGVATAPAFDRDLDKVISDKVVGQMLTSVGGKKLSVLLSKRIPIIGGGVGAINDGWTTLGVGNYARESFVDRRMR